MVNKIVHISLGKANPNRMNGVNKVLHSLLSAQADTAKIIEFWGISFSEEHNYPSRTFETKLYKDNRLKFRLDRKLRKDIIKLAKEGNTVVHLHGAFLPQLYTIARLLVKNNIPYIFTPHGGYNIQALKNSLRLKLAYMKLFESFVVSNAKSIQLIGASEYTGLIKHMKPQDFRLIPNGQQVIPTKEVKHFKSTKTLNLGYLGRIDIQTKGLDLLLKALFIVKDEILVNLSIIGDGGDIETLKKHVKEMNLQKYVSFKGALFGEDKFTALRELDAFCLVSRNEGLPGVVLEAAAVGVPSIVSTQTNMAEYITKANAGWVIYQYNEHALAEKFKEVSSNKENSTLQDKSKNAILMISDVFSWKEIAKNLDGLYAL
jgi:glycosyltransferase involved in cell wall biosynthesis